MADVAKADRGFFDEAAVSKAVDKICAAEGIVPSKLLSVAVTDSEISVRYARSNGCNRTSTYPLAALRQMAAPASGARDADESAFEIVTNSPGSLVFA